MQGPEQAVVPLGSAELKLRLPATSDNAPTMHKRLPSWKQPCTQSFLVEMRLRASPRSSASPKGV